MQDLEKLREIEALGREDGEEAPSPEEIPSKGGFAPIFQAVLCLAILAGLLCLKAMDSPFYEAFSEWYHQRFSCPAGRHLPHPPRLRRRPPRWPAWRL